MNSEKEVKDDECKDEPVSYGGNDCDQENVSDKNIQMTSSSMQELQSVAEDAVDYFQKQGEIELSQTCKSADCNSKYVPGPLHAKGILTSEIQQNLLSLILRSEEDTNSGSFNRIQDVLLDEVGKLALVSRTLAAYVCTLDSKLVRGVAMQVVSDTSLWISRMFRFFDSLVYFHNESREGLLRVARMVIHAKYPKFSTNGYEVLYTRPPVIYVSDTTRPGLGQYLCSQLGLPTACLTSVPCNTMFGSQYKMDTTALEKMIQEDTAAAKTPLLVVASAGTPMVGHVDNLQRLQELCRANGIWLHVEGHSLAALCLVSVPNLILSMSMFDSPSNVGDSMTLPIGIWLGMPSLPCVTLYKSREAVHVHAAGLSHTLHGHLDFMPLWIVLQAFGMEGVIQRIQHCFELSDYLLEVIEAFPELQVIGKERLKSKEGCTYAVADIGKKSISTTVLFDILTSVVVFQYVLKSYDDASSSEDKEQASKELTKNPPYFDNLNSWLGQILARDVPTVQTDILDLDQHGVCLRISPLETAHAMNTTKKDIDSFCISLQQQLSILNATVHQKAVLYQKHNNHRKLQLVEISNWAGMGGARYIPEFWAEGLNELTDTGKEDINRLNSELVIRLKSSDSAFSIGEADDGMLCVRFGMVTDDLDMEELVSLVLSTGQEIEESSKFLETMSEMVRQGIEEANKELLQENQERIMQEGILRQVPVIGSLYSWWYPSRKESGIKGRSFNLSSGVVESTENIYKYHMQIQEGSSTTPPPATKILISPSSCHSHVSQISQGMGADKLPDSKDPQANISNSQSEK